MVNSGFMASCRSGARLFGARRLIALPTDDGRAAPATQGRGARLASGISWCKTIAAAPNSCNMMAWAAMRGDVDASGGDGFVDHGKKSKNSLLGRDDVLRLLRDAVAKAGNQSAWARKKNIN